MSCHAKLPEVSEGHLEPEEDEEEDIDFNPFLKETLSPEASSSLSSENEGLGADLMDNVGSSCKDTNLSFGLQNSVGRDLENDGEEVVMQSRMSTSEKELEDTDLGKAKKRKSVSISPKEIVSNYLEGTSGFKEIIPGKENNSSGGTDVEVVDGEKLPHSRNLSKPVIDLDDDEDAICRRTRARYSLANFTLEELETFLQESDDDDEFQNVDDEQEYRKFLAAVLQGGDNEGQILPENANIDDEDEDNDADFEIEIEEALDSDLDETTRVQRQKERYGVEGRRPETRQNKRQKTSVQSKKKLLGQANRPLRPLLPCVPNAQLAPFPSLDWQKLVPDNSQHCYSSPAQGCHINGFTPNQVGQLHCLIHEHVQLLLQVFSLCVLDPSRQSIAIEVKRMIQEVVHKRDEVSSRRKIPYPGFCFRPPHIHPSVSDGLPKFHQVQCLVESAVVSDPNKECSSANDMPVSLCPSDGRNNEDVSRRHVDSMWVPLISGPVLSILDVAPLSLVGRYMADVSRAVQQYQLRYTELVSNSHFEREPLFPLPNLPAFAEASNEVSRGGPSPGTCTVSSTLPVHQQPKKSLAATLVESTKKQSVALVPKEIVKLAQRFYPLFNSALFPHKPPPVPVANRVLFTDAEDELLATGLMECNTDWKAIQQRFLPCKSKHQIFVRQKNRCSSKAPENSIKAVRRMKTSPLTAEEKARIHEGLRVLKLDWMSVWKCIVPYRDPSLLPRQWRIAQGTQKSYKTDPAKKEKRRLYESQRRKSKAAASANWQTASEKEDYLAENADEENQSGNDHMEDEDEAYVHEAFLADWRPENSKPMSSELALSSLNRSDLQPGGLLPLEGAGVGENPGCGEPLPMTGYMQNVSHFTHVRYSASYTVASNHLGPDWISKSSKRQVSLRPYRVRRSKVSKLVKLAPDLPPVNLPPSVRVISQSAFKSYHCGSSNSSKVTSGGVGAENLDTRVAPVAKSVTTNAVDAGKGRNIPSYHDTANVCHQGSGFHMDQCVIEEKGSESDLQMHPLLFQASEDGRLPYNQMNCSTSATSTFNFLPGNQFQTNLNLLPKAQHLGPPVDQFYTSLGPKEVPSSTYTIDFHPLLQKNDTVNSNSVMGSSDGQMEVNIESFGSKFVQLRNPSDAILTEPHVIPATVPEPASPFEKANDLDLEIHLSSTSRKEKVVKSGNVTENTSSGSRIDLLGGSTTKECQKVHSTCYQMSNSLPAASIATCTSNKIHALGVHPMVLASDNVGDQSLPEIVMEQEELSDSEEEIGEHVEFECEEMADSDGDDSDCGQLVETRNKEVQEITTEEIVTNGGCKDHQRKARSGNCPKGNLRATNNFNIRSSMTEFPGKGNDATSNRLQVNLDVSPIGKNLSSRPRRLCKKITPSIKGDSEMISAETTRASRNPRRRLYRNDSAGNSGSVDCSAGFPPDENSPQAYDDPKNAMDVICLGL